MIRIQADNLPRFMTCNGSISMPAPMPINDDTTARDEGTAAHYMATAVFNNQFEFEELIDRKAPNGIYLTSEMAEHVNEYLNIIKPEYDDIHSVVEIDTSYDRSPAWAVDGRSDYIKRRPNLLRVIDFKYGWRLVEPKKNWTLISHAIGYIMQHQFDPNAENLQIELCIFQPRPHHPDGKFRKWVISLAELTQYHQQIDTALSEPRNELRTSDHCHKCRAVATCPAARAAEMNAIDTADMVFSDTVDNAFLAWNLDNLNRAEQMLKSRKEAFEELAKHRIKSGQVVQGYNVEMGYGNSRWKDGITPALLNAMTGKDLTKAGTVTPAEAKRRGVSETTIKSLSERLPSGIKLVRSSAHKQAEKLFTDTITKGS